MSISASGRVDSLLKATAVAAFAAGVICLAAGAWIPIKAWAAQLLIDAVRFPAAKSATLMKRIWKLQSSPTPTKV